MLRRLGQPGCKQEKTANLTKLDAQKKSDFRSNAMRLMYLAQDRIDVQFSGKELARAMSEPTAWDEGQLKRAVRYLIGKPRVAQQFRQQPRQSKLTVFTDSDFAGCLKTRKSTSCSMVFYGAHLLRSTVTTQGIVSLSSGEAEIYSAVKGASVGIGCQNLMRDMGVTFSEPILLRVDSTACLGMCGRKGAGRVRHIHTPTLWLQQAVANKIIILDKVVGTENPADLGTKPLGAAGIDKVLVQCGFVSLT